jgi:uncharacterized protein YciI
MKRGLAPFVALVVITAVSTSAIAGETPVDKKQYLYRLQLIPRLVDDSNWTDADNKIVEEHFERLKKMLAGGTLVLAGRTLNQDESAFGIVIFEAASEKEARRIMEGDPAVREGIMTAELFPYRVALIRAEAAE